MRNDLRVQSAHMCHCEMFIFQLRLLQIFKQKKTLQQLKKTFLHSLLYLLIDAEYSIPKRCPFGFYCSATQAE